MNYFHKKDLPMNEEMINFWDKNGYLVIEDFNTEEECDKIIKRSSYLIDNNNLDILSKVSFNKNISINKFLKNFCFLILVKFANINYS